jgi:hydroxymethylglutaryl-CoA reductase (NADPH)
LLIAPKTARFIARIRGMMSITEAVGRLEPRHDAPRPFRVVPRLWDRLIAAGVVESARRALADEATIAAAERYNPNIESMIGTVKVPVGIVGPLRLNGIHAHGDYFVPMATTEAALVASYSRGAVATNRAGGIAATTLSDGILRTPAFRFGAIAEAGRFVDWVEANQDLLSAAANATTRYGALVAIDPAIDGEVVFLLCGYFTGDAAGQNMVTIATDALCRAAVAQCPVMPLSWFLEGNYSVRQEGLVSRCHARARARGDRPGRLAGSRHRTSAWLQRRAHSRVWPHRPSRRPVERPDRCTGALRQRPRRPLSQRSPSCSCSSGRCTLPTR